MIVRKSSSAPPPEKRNAFAWVPSLFFTSGFPFFLVTSLSIIMYKRFGISNAEIAFYTGWLYLPWVLKPLWSPIVDIFKTRRKWIYWMEFIIGAGFACVAFTIPIPDFFQFSLLFLWIIAFSSATHDISADGFYLLALDKKEQAANVGTRLLFYRGAMVIAQSVVVILIGFLESSMSVGTAEFKVVSTQNLKFVESVKFDSLQSRPLPGSIRVIAQPSTVEISTLNKTVDDVSSFVAFAHNLNVMNGFLLEPLSAQSLTPDNTPAGNFGAVWVHLSKQPDKGKEYLVKLKLKEGDSGIKIIEGGTLKFNSNNWSRPAVVVIQLDKAITAKTEAAFMIETERVPIVWMIAFGVFASFFILAALYHRIFLPDPAADGLRRETQKVPFVKEYFRTIFRFFEKKKIGMAILFLLFYRFGEAQLAKMSTPFLMDNREAGGLSLSLNELGLMLGAGGAAAFVIGALAGGYLISKKGLRFCIWFMYASMIVPPVIYVMLAFFQPGNSIVVLSCIAGEQLFTGFGIAGYFMFMFLLSDGEYRTSYFAFAAGFMALGLMLPGMLSGFIQQIAGYKIFFALNIFAALPAFFIIKGLHKRKLYMD